MKQVRDMRLNTTQVDEIIDEMMESGGFTAKKLAHGVKILSSMQDDLKCLRFLSFPACLMATGLRGPLKDLIKDHLFDAIITTTGTLDHDLARIWEKYYQGSFNMDDAILHNKGINRLGNILIPNESYGIILEKKLTPLFEKIYEKKKEYAGYQLIWEIGEQLEKEENKESSLTYWAYKNRIPVFIPGFFDGAFGSQLWMHWQTKRDHKINQLLDEQKLADLIFEAEKTGALMIGGGISKHHTIWWNQYRGGLDYSVYITTAPEYDGSLSGARMREAISWGKLKENASYVTIESDATLALPFMIPALRAKQNKKKKSQ